LVKVIRSWTTAVNKLSMTPTKASAIE
jgi:hypothetical protein